MLNMSNIKLDCEILNTLDSRFFTVTKSMPLSNPLMVSTNLSLANEMSLENDTLSSEEFLHFVNGNHTCEGSTSYANAYSGHQFGYPVPELGDGRALSLGKLHNYHLQLKGSGPTAYSRNGDGRAVLRSSIREYLMSESMYALGVPTSRALAIISSDTKVFREYQYEKGSIVLRASSSWIRFGSFEFAYYSKNKEKDIAQLADYVIDESYTKLKNKPNKYEELYFTIVDKTIEMIALWQSVGFMHGVMNTDNMSIDGLTIDYGPYAVMEVFEKGFTCNTSDYEGRYSYENQPFIAQWNLSVLAKTLSVIADEKLMNGYNDSFIGKFKKQYFEIMAAKLGLINSNYEKDWNLIIDLIDALEVDNVDYTSFFHCLSTDTLTLEGVSINNWLKKYNQRLELETTSKEDRLASMRKVNPKYILRNYMLQEAIEKAENNDFTLVNDLLKIAQNPYDEHTEFEHYSKPNKDTGILKCSCSS
jgi:uncharacterized protein YdiU (UPF0061 family)